MGIIYSSSVSGSSAARPHLPAGGGPAPLPGDQSPDPPSPNPTAGPRGGSGWEGEDGLGAGPCTTGPTPPTPAPLGPQFLHLGQGEELASADLGGPSQSDVLNLKNPAGPRLVAVVGGEGVGRQVAIGTGAQGCPGLSGLAFCPETALVTLDTRARAGDGDQGMVWSESLVAGTMEGS